MAERKPKKKRPKKKYKTAAWTRTEGQNPDGGLNEKGRASLRAKVRTLSRRNRAVGLVSVLTVLGVLVKRKSFQEQPKILTLV